jgi:hypothetical protein
VSLNLSCGRCMAIRITPSSINTGRALERMSATIVMPVTPVISLMTWYSCQVHLFQSVLAVMDVTRSHLD